MYNVSPIPDFNDHSKVQQFIQDRRVIGVRFFHLLSFYFISHSFFTSTILSYNLLFSVMRSSLPATPRKQSPQLVTMQHAS